jgi:hypothetical protein
VVFPTNASATDSAEYVVMPQLAAGVPGQTAGYRLLGDTIRPAVLSPPASPAALADLSPAERFHTFLRLGDESRWQGLGPRAQAFRSAPALLPSGSPAQPAGPPAVGSLRAFKACKKLDCSQFADITARALVVKAKVAVFVDTLAPAGLDSAALDSLATIFNDRLYAVDTAAFGRESDIDTNSVVMVLMTPTVNKLVTSAECQSTGFVAGFFFGADLDPAFRTDPRSNKAEVFYSIVADPAGTLSCAHSVAQVERIIPVTFVHEFQHMISYNQHVLELGGSGEVLWLNEGFSHLAEELGGRSFIPGTSADSATFSRFVIGDLFNAYTYLDSTYKRFLLPTEGIGSLGERGAAWLFVRYVVDHYAADTSRAAQNAFTRAMLATTLTGAQNVVAQTGDPFQTVVTRWALANWASDLPVSGFTAPPELQYVSWNFRVTYSSLHDQQASTFLKIFPLMPTVSAGRSVNLNGTLHAGSGTYHRILQAPSEAGFTLLFSSSTGGPLDPARFPRLNVIRIR